ncbi:hypothetical protein Tco_0966818 [Tanacetum coccineum]
MPNNVKTYDGTGDPEDHLKIFQAMGTGETYRQCYRCHMVQLYLDRQPRGYGSMTTSESIDGKGRGDPLSIHEVGWVSKLKSAQEGAPGMHAEKPLPLPKRKFTHRENHKTSLNGMLPSENLTSKVSQGKDGGLAEKRSSNKFCDFHNDKGHSTDEYMQLKKQIEELVRAGKLSHLIKEIKQGRDQMKNGKKEAPVKDKSLVIYMIQPWQRTTKQKLTQSFAYGNEITFPPLANSDGTEGPLVIEAEIGGHMIHRMYIDGGSFTEILYEHCFNQLWPEIKSQMVPARTSSLYKSVDGFHDRQINFTIQYIIGRPGIREIQAVPSTAHGMLKFPADGGIVTIRSTILIPAKSAIGGRLSLKDVTVTSTLLKKNLDIFAWQPSNMTRVPRSIAEHHLNIWEGYSPVQQKKRGQALERAKVIQAEVQKLVEAGIMREVYYHDWLSNPVMVKKHDGSW